MKLKYVPLLGGAGLIAIAAFARPMGLDAVDPFDALGALLACALAGAACFGMRTWTWVTSLVVVGELALHLVDSCNRVVGYPDKEVWWVLDVLWLPLIGAAWWRKMWPALAMIPVIVAASWIAFGTRLAVYSVGPLRTLDWKGAQWQPDPRATVKVIGDRVWVDSCVGPWPAVAVYRGPERAARTCNQWRPVHAERLENIAVMVDGTGSMDPQRANVPLPFARLVRCR